MGSEGGLLPDLPRGAAVVSPACGPRQAQRSRPAAPLRSPIVGEPAMRGGPFGGPSADRRGGGAGLAPGGAQTGDLFDPGGPFGAEMPLEIAAQQGGKARASARSRYRDGQIAAAQHRRRMKIAAAEIILDSDQHPGGRGGPGDRGGGRSGHAGDGFVEQRQPPARRHALPDQHHPDAGEIDGDRQHQAMPFCRAAIAARSASRPRRWQKSPNPSPSRRPSANSANSGSSASAMPASGTLSASGRLSLVPAKSPPTNSA